MAPEFEAAARDLELMARLAKLDTERVPEIAARFGIRSIPMMMLFSEGLEKKGRAAPSDAWRSSPSPEAVERSAINPVVTIAPDATATSDSDGVCCRCVSAIPLRHMSKRRRLHTRLRLSDGRAQSLR